MSPGLRAVMARLSDAIAWESPAPRLPLRLDVAARLGSRRKLGYCGVIGLPIGPRRPGPAKVAERRWEIGDIVGCWKRGESP